MKLIKLLLIITLKLIGFFFSIMAGASTKESSAYDSYSTEYEPVGKNNELIQVYRKR